MQYLEFMCRVRQHILHPTCWDYTGELYRKNVNAAKLGLQNSQQIGLKTNVPKLRYAFSYQERCCCSDWWEKNGWSDSFHDL